jgi:hypothetical protein
MHTDLIHTACLIRGRKVPLSASNSTLGKNLPIEIPSLKSPSRTKKENVKVQSLSDPARGGTILLKTQDGNIRMKYRIDGQDPVERSMVTHDRQNERRRWSVKCLNPNRYRSTDEIPSGNLRSCMTVRLIGVSRVLNALTLCFFVSSWVAKKSGP